MYHAERSTQQVRYLVEDTRELSKECEQIREDIRRLLAASGKLENAALAMLDYLNEGMTEYTYNELKANTRAALREWQVVVAEVEEGTDE